MNLLFPSENVKILTVSELTREIKGLLDDAFPSVWVTGQISNYKPAASRHIYLTLKDAEAQLQAVIWRSTAATLRFEPHDGLEVIARGKLDVYVPHGAYKLIIEELHPKGLGALELAFRQLHEKLLRLGYFAPARKKPLPRMPRRIALVTSPTGAAIRDMLEILGRRWPCLEVLVCPVRVQGEGATEEIAAAIQLLNQLQELDVMIVGRGGGSLEDLWAFNEEQVAQAIFASRIPVITAIGHEIDLTIADLVADRRALTPSEAAEIVVPNREQVLEELRGLGGQLRNLVTQRLQRGGERLDALKARSVFRLPLENIRDREQRMDDLAKRLRRALGHKLDHVRQRLQADAARLEGLSPLNVLGRGYSLTRRQADMVIVRSPDQVRPGDRLQTEVQRGRIISRVEETQPTNPAPSEIVTEEDLFAWSAHE